MLLFGFGATPRRSKTDPQEEDVPGANAQEPAFCPLTAHDAWLAHRRTARDLDRTASTASRAERPLFCAVTRTGRITGERLSDKAVARLVKQAARDARLDPSRR
jgi:hypothetical protein